MGFRRYAIQRRTGAGAGFVGVPIFGGSSDVDQPGEVITGMRPAAVPVIEGEAWTNHSSLRAAIPARLICYAGRGYRRRLRLLAVVFARPLVGSIKTSYPRTDFNHFLDTAEQFADGVIDRENFLRVANPIRRLLPRLQGGWAANCHEGL